MAERRLRCRAQVWERGRWIHAYQCLFAAKGEMPMRTRAGETKTLPACGIHLRQRSMTAYWPNNPPWDDDVKEYKD